MSDKDTMPGVVEQRERDAEPEAERAAARPSRPVLPGQPAETAGGRELVRTLRVFCATGRDPGGALATPRDGVLPALMHELRDGSRVRTGDPIVLTHDTPAVAAFADWLDARLGEAFAPDTARELRDNAARLERAAKRLASGEDRPGTLTGLLEAVSDEVIAEIGLRGAPKSAMRADTAAIVEKIDDRDRFTVLADDAPLAIMLHLTTLRVRAARGAFAERTRAARDRVRRRLERDGGAASDDTAGSWSGSFDPAALGAVLGRTPRGTAAMTDARRDRLTRLVEQLDAALGDPAESPLALVVFDELASRAALGSPGIEGVKAELPAAEAAARFDAAAEAMLPVFLAVRTAELEADDAYDPAVHDVYAESFSRERLSDDEMAVLPAVIAVESIERLCGPDMPNVARAMLSGRPIRVLLESEPAANMLPAADHEPLRGARFEPGVFGVGLRAAIVHQSSVSAVDHLASGFERAIGSRGPSLHVVAAGVCEGGVEPSVGRWLHAGAAVDGRAHPLFLYDPRPGPSWAEGFEFEGNEQPEADWPAHELRCVDAVGVERPMPLPFTFADFAILEPAYAEHYRIIPDDCPTGDLATAAEVIAEPRDGDRRVPFVWAADAEGRMHRLAVARPLIEASRDRLSCWRTLQQFAGVHDVYAERAAEGASRRASEAGAAEIARLKAEHEAELERVRREEASGVLGRLAESIVGVDLSRMVAPASRVGRAGAPSAEPTAEPAVQAPADAAPAEPAQADEDDDLGLGDPYIDSPLCTTCNDCINLNSRLFVYNANKQAEIGDPDAGTFEQLVIAAEKCPARCIHPGKPRNPDEPGLDGLVARAQKFN